MTDDRLSINALAAKPLAQVAGLTRWVGNGRKLTQTGRLTLADARELVALLDTGDNIDPVIGEKVFPTKTSEDLRGLTTIVHWAKAAGLVRVVRGRLVTMKKNAPLLDRPADLWSAMFDVFGQLGDAVCPSGWYSSPLGNDFADGFATILAGMSEGGGAITVADAGELVWATLVARYRMDDATEEQLRHWRRATDRDLRFMTALLVEFGAFTEDAGTLRLTPLTDWAQRRGYATEKPGEPIAQIKVTLQDLHPPVWRRLLVPAKIRLDRLDQVIQAAMGWHDYHLHMFNHHTHHYGIPDPELQHRDERKTTLHDLTKHEGESLGYVYDFGDSWEHEILVEKLIPADPGVRYPTCIAGARACPPEDCGGTHGYTDLIETLADPDHPEHEAMLQWLGLDKGTDFQPDRFDLDDTNHRLDVTTARTPR
jgi:Plasmid pRiA4b ORF-3-like protein